MVPLLRVYDVNFMDFENFNEKKNVPKKKRTLVRFFSGRLLTYESYEIGIRKKFFKKYKGKLENSQKSGEKFKNTT